MPQLLSIVQAREAAKSSQQAQESGYLKAALNKLVPDGDDPAKQACPVPYTPKKSTLVQ